MKTRTFLVVAVLAIVLGSVLVACGGAKEGAEPAGGASEVALDGKALTEERCTKCHDLKRVEAAAKTRDGWQATVERMVTIGAELNEAEQEAVINYLAQTYK